MNQTQHGQLEVSLQVSQPLSSLTRWTPRTLSLSKAPTKWLPSPHPTLKLIKIEGRFFSLNKTQARLQLTLAKKLFTEILATEQPNHILAYAQ